jgi:hypothetical protein
MFSGVVEELQSMPVRTFRFRALALVLLLAAGAAGCRQPEGTIPTPQGEQANKVGDIARDLMAVARREPDAAMNLADDLGSLTPAPPPAVLLQDLTSRLNDALGGSGIDENATAALARALFVTIEADDLNVPQITALQEDISRSLAAAGVSAEKAQPVADAVQEIQSAVTQNRRRWWHWR